jgi:acyl-CoA dehydrogenase
MATRIFAGRAMLLHAAGLRDRGGSITVEASMVKVFCTETASWIAGRAMDILCMSGGLAGAMTDRRLETFFRDVRLYRIYEGTSEIQRIIIARDLLKGA